MLVEEWKRKNPPIQRKPITNADRIRAMTDEELAKFLTKVEYGDAPCIDMLWLDWLKQEEKE